MPFSSAVRDFHRTTSLGNLELMRVVEIIGQVTVGLICDRIGRKTAMVGTTLMIVLGGILSTAASGPSKSSQDGHKSTH